jgi:hypothetical protein
MDGKTEARKGGADWEKEAYCHFLCTMSKQTDSEQTDRCMLALVQNLCDSLG